MEMTEIEQARKEVQAMGNAYMRKVGKLGGLVAAAAMTPEQRVARATKASHAAATQRSKRAQGAREEGKT